MLKFLKLGLIFFVGIILLLLINISFFSGEKIDKINNLEFTKYSFSGAFIKNINYLDNIYSYKKDDFLIKKSENNVEINLKKGVFILDLNDISKNYKIISNGFELDIKGVGDIYIDTNTTKNFIFSLSSSFVLNFLNKDGEFINSNFMYPHEWIKFNPKLNFIYKKADLYRIRTTTKNGYLKEDLSSVFQKNIELIGKQNIDIFTKYIINKKDLYDSNDLIYKKLFLLKSNNLPFSDFINKYKYYFINDSKKIIFLKNDIYNNLIKLIKEKSIGNNGILNIKNDLLKIKEINKNEYKKIISFINNIYKVVLLKNNSNDFGKIGNLAILLDKNNINKKAINFFNLKNIYFNSDINKINFSKDRFNLFINLYVKELNDNEGIEVESFIFYLYEYIDGNFFIAGLENFKSEVEIFQKYILFTKKIYLGKDIEKSDSKIKTIIKKDKILLIKIEKYLRKNFFKENRNNLNLLELKKSNIKLENLLKLKKDIYNVFINFDKYQNILDDIDIKEYNSLISYFDEEFLALTDYEQYKIKYNKNLGDLYNLTGIGAKQIKKYSVSDIISYFKQFNGISFNENNINKKDDFFEVKDVEIYGEKYNFNLYPNIGNKLNIKKYSINGNIEKNIIYDLDFYENILKEKFKGAKKEEKYKYDFKNFFLQKFKLVTDSGSKIDIIEICKLKNMIPDYSNPGKCKKLKKDLEVISVFKENTLIGEEFSIIKDYFKVKYSNLDITYDKKNYLISLNNTEVLINVFENNIKQYKLLFNSNYDIKKHEFYNVSFKMNDLSNKEKLLFDGALIKLQYKKIKITDLKKYLEDYLQNNLSDFKNIYSNIRGKYIIDDFEINNLFSKNILKFNINNKNIIIKVEKNKILSIIVNNVNILENSIDINDLKNYLGKLN